MLDDETVSVVEVDKRRYLDLLLLADEDVRSIDLYLDRGELLVMDIGQDTVAVCVTTDEGGGVLEVQSLAVRPDWQRRGLGSRMLAEVEARNRGRFDTIIIGTGDSPITVPFYQACGYTIYKRIPRGVADAYDHPIFENGIQLIDKVYLRRQIS